jgi:hypothetical protein
MNYINYIMSNKQALGQFYTTNYNYIFNNIVINEKNTRIIEPFAGEGHLTSFAVSQLKIIENVLEYDIDPKNQFIKQRDTLLDPPDYKDFYIITNPPYLARNKCDNKLVFDKYGENDLYKCFLRNLTTNQCSGGIIIIPLNFFCSIRKSDIELRRDFMQVYAIGKIRIFEEQVFDDTSYTVCVVQFINQSESSTCQHEHIDSTQNIHVEFYPTKIMKTMELSKENLYTFGGHMYCLPKNENVHIERLTHVNIIKKNSNLLLKCIDDNNESRLGVYYIEKDDELFIDETEKLSARAYATLIIEPELSIHEQKNIATRFNNFVNKNRAEYNSLFLTNYRESKNGFARKRISMSHAYDIVKHLLINA